MDTFRVMTIAVDGTVDTTEWDTTSGTLDHLRTALGGWVDVVSLSPTLDMWVNDEGLINGMEVNQVATALARTYGLAHQPYAGPAVLTGGADAEGNTCPLSESQVRLLLTLLGELAR